MPASPWDPEQYERFQRERSQPFHDLLALVRPRARMRVLDLGCGTGELTQHLHRTLGAERTLGVDSSETMLARSAAFAADGLEFRRQRIDALEPAEDGTWDLVFSNAALQWLDDHEELIERLARLVAPGGQLAVQVPANHDHASHTVAAEIAREAPFRNELAGYVRGTGVLPPEQYATLLERLGFAEHRTHLEVYGHRLPGPLDVIEWVKGTLLTAYQQRMPAAAYERFLATYKERLLSVLGDARPHFYPFKRILFWGTR